MEEKIPCIRIVNKNLRLVEEGKPLEEPLRFLNKSCNFRKRYNILFDLKNEEEIEKEVKAKRKEYHQKPEVKAKRKEYYQKHKK